MTYKFEVWPAAVALVLVSSPVFADDEDFNRFGISLGVFVTERDSQSRLDGSLGSSGTEIDLEGDLGLNSSDSVFRIDGYYRFNEKHRLDFSAFDLSRTSTRTIQKDIEWNDTIFPIDTSVESDFDLEIYKLAYTWSFMRRDQGYLGLTAGFYVADIGTRLHAETLGSTESRGVTAPLPVIGLRGEYDISDKFTFRASGEIFALEYEEYDGSLFDLYVGLDYQLFEHAAVGVGFNSVKLDVAISKQNFTGNFDWQYDGGLLFVKFDF